MTYYVEHIARYKRLWDSKQGQIDTAISTRNYIDNHYQQDINLDLLSRVRLTSKYHLLRLFKRYYGLTPRQYLKDVRIKRAKEHLRNGMSVTETCYAVGFESPASFSHLFKQKVGQTPRAYRKAQLSISV